MKDYYYILGLRQDATNEEIKKAYKKLSLKFHPDKNEGDKFFEERFKEIQEAYDILIDASQRKIYDNQIKRNQYYASNNQTSNFSPEIVYFSSDKPSFRYGEQVIIKWKVINADKVIIKPFGTVEPIGTKTYKINDFRNEKIKLELIAENTYISRKADKSIYLSNETYSELYQHFKGRIINEIKEEEHDSFGESEEIQGANYLNGIELVKNHKDLNFTFWVTICFSGLFILASMYSIINRKPYIFYFSGGMFCILYYFITAKSYLIKILKDDFSDKIILTRFLNFCSIVTYLNAAIILIAALVYGIFTIKISFENPITLIELSYVALLLLVAYSMMHFVFTTKRIFKDIDAAEVEYVEEVNE